MEQPTPTPDNGRQPRGLARFWPGQGMAVPVQRQSDQDPDPATAGVAPRDDHPPRTDGPTTGSSGAQQMNGPHRAQPNGLTTGAVTTGTPGTAAPGSAQLPGPQDLPAPDVPPGQPTHGPIAQAPPEQDLLGHQAMTHGEFLPFSQAGAATEQAGPAAHGSGVHGSGLLLPNGQPAASGAASTGSSPLDQPAHEHQPLQDGPAGDRREGPREPNGFGPTTAHPSLTSDTQMVALGFRRDILDDPRDGEQPGAPTGSGALRGWTGNQPAYTAPDDDRTAPGHRNGDVPRHGSIPGVAPVNGLPGATANRLPPAVSPAVGPGGAGPVRPVSSGSSPVRPLSPAYPVPGPHGARSADAGPGAQAPSPVHPLSPAYPAAGGPGGQQASTAAPSVRPGSAPGEGGGRSSALPTAPASRPVSSQPVPVIHQGGGRAQPGPSTDDRHPLRDDRLDGDRYGASPGTDRPGPGGSSSTGSSGVVPAARRAHADADADAVDDSSVVTRRSTTLDDAQPLPEHNASRLEPAAVDEQRLRPGDVEQTRITLWDDDATRQFHEEWHEVKAQFVDDPVAALTRAHDLLTEAVHELTESLLAERDDLDPLRRTSTPDTESMRMAMRGYREFLDRILAL